MKYEFGTEEPRVHFSILDSKLTIHHCSPARICGTSSGLTFSKYLSLICTTVGKPQAPRHSTSITIQRPLALISPISVPVCLRNAFSTSSPPQRLHEMFVQTWIRYFPSGCRLYMV